MVVKQSGGSTRREANKRAESHQRDGGRNYRKDKPGSQGTTEQMQRPDSAPAIQHQELVMCSYKSICLTLIQGLFGSGKFFCGIAKPFIDISFSPMVSVATYSPF